MNETVVIPMEEYNEVLRKAIAYDLLREYNMRSDVVSDDATKAILGLNYKPYLVSENELCRCNTDLPFPGCGTVRLAE